MKRITMISMAVLLMFTVSCKKDKKMEFENAGSGFRATVEKHDGDGKTYLDGTAVKWSENDAIAVKSGSCSEAKRFTTLATATRADFEAAEDLPADFYTPNYTAFYPAASFDGNQLTLPATQTYVENGFANGANPMAATSSETLLPFKNVCGMLKLQLYRASSYLDVKSITLTSNKSDEKLCGTGVVTFNGDGEPVLALTEGSHSLTLNCDGAKIYTEATPFYFVVPAGTLSEGFTIKVTDTEGKVWSKTTTADNTIVRSKITVMPNMEVGNTQEPVVPSSVTVTAGCVDCTYTVSGTVEVPSGTHTCEYGLVYSETDATPTIEEGASKLVVNTETFSGTKSFTADIARLTEDVKYYVRAYAMIDGLAYSSEETVQVVTYTTPKPLADSWTGGKSPKEFSVSESKKVYFSQGNLQYIGSAATPYWKFADRQFECFGNNGQGSDNQYIDRDLFGWGSTGIAPTNDEFYVNYQPWATSTIENVSGDYNYYGYGPSTNRPHPEDGEDQRTLLVSNGSDWGANPISNGGGLGWRTLNNNEWNYIFYSRGSADQLYGEGTIGNCKNGLIILPDEWDGCPDGLSFTSGASDFVNKYSYSEWQKMEEAGALFLPATGYRLGTSVEYVGSFGYCWSSDPYFKPGESVFYSKESCRPIFYSEHVYNEHLYRHYGLPVRLVKDAN